LFVPIEERIAAASLEKSAKQYFKKFVAAVEETADDETEE